MFRSVGFYALKHAIRSAGPANVYRDIARQTRKHIVDAPKRTRVNRTVRFFLRNDNVTFEQLVENPDIQCLVREAGTSLQSNPFLAEIIKKIK